MLAYVIFFCGFLNVALNLVTIVVLVIRKRQDSSKPLHKRRRTPELKLFIIALIGCFNILLEVSLFLAVRILPNGSPVKAAFFVYQPFMLDWYYLSPVWTIVVLCPSVRKQLFDFCSIGKSSGSVGSTSSVLPPAQ
uniref:Serpentine receptor class gamma n=1 Tax=Acrobeloides nanus TaxID=290746 RepID=A0A914EJM0_9BILA